ncbi:MAG: DNA primase, partial [Firmicutes bacterium]|nr:DNA primase [Bacillota bacterium]
MAFFSQDFLYELQQRNDIVDVVSTYVEIKRKGGGKTYTGLCPFHNEKTPSFTVYPDSQSFYCFGCGAGGNVISFIEKRENLDFVETVKFLAVRAGMEIPDDGGAEVQSSRKRNYEANQLAARFFFDQLNTEEGREARAYLRRRGLTDATIKKFGMGYAPQGWDSLRDYLRSKGFHDEELVTFGLCARSQKGSVFDFFRNRVMFPVFDIRGKVIAFSGRRLHEEDSPRKYVN